MDVPNKRDWFNVGAIVPLLVLFISAIGLFTRAGMSLETEILWAIVIIVVAFLVWFNCRENAAARARR
jgi:positive regulator of sigma E activity